MNQPRFTHITETLEQKLIQPANILTIPKLGSGNMGTWEPSLSSLQPLSIFSSHWLWVEVSNLLCFYVFFSIFVVGIFISLLLKHH